MDLARGGCPVEGTIARLTGLLWTGQMGAAVARQETTCWTSSQPGRPTWTSSQWSALSCRRRVKTKSNLRFRAYLLLVSYQDRLEPSSSKSSARLRPFGMFLIAPIRPNQSGPICDVVSFARALLKPVFVAGDSKAGWSTPIISAIAVTHVVLPDSVNSS